MIDLHIHTAMSDGEHAPSEVAALAARAGVSVMSVTDHDTVSGVPEAAAAARDAGLGFIPGIEISVKGNRELHILGYYIDTEDRGLSDMCERFRRLRVERERRIFEYLRGKGIELAPELLEKYAAHGRAGRPHFARAMLEAGFVSDYREAFDRYLATPEFNAIERPKPGFDEGISAIRAAGGAAVLAHPALLGLGDEELESLLRELISAGLKGLECHYSAHTREQTALYLSLAGRYDLAVTGGSDFHGENVKPDIMIGTGIRNSLCFDDENAVQRLLEAANER